MLTDTLEMGTRLETLVILNLRANCFDVHDVPANFFQPTHFSFPLRQFGKTAPVEAFNVVFNRFKWLHYYHTVHWDAGYCFVGCKGRKDEVVSSRRGELFGEGFHQLERRHEDLHKVRALWFSQVNSICSGEEAAKVHRAAHEVQSDLLSITARQILRHIATQI